MGEESRRRPYRSIQEGGGVLVGDVQAGARGDPRLSGAKERSEGLRPASVVAEEDTPPRPIPRCGAEARGKTLLRDSRNGAVNELRAEVQRIQWHALIVPVHALVLRLQHRDR